MAHTQFTFGGLQSYNTSLPVIGEVRYDSDRDTMQTWTGQDWVTLYGHKETVQETVKESLDRVAAQVEEDHPDNVAIQDALKEWEDACERFQVILALAGKK